MRRFTLLASGAAIAALVLAGCGDNQTPSQGGGGAAPDPQVGTLKLLAENVAKKSAEKSSAHMVFKADAAGQSIEGSGDVKLGAEPAMQVTMTLPPGRGSMEMRLVDEIFYVKLSKELEPGKPWLKIDANRNDPVSRAVGSAVEQMKATSDPSQLLKQLQDAGEITGTKQEDLNGKPTTRYSITVDVNKLASLAVLGDARNAGIDKFPLDVWVDQEELPARIAMEIPVKDPQTQQSTNDTVTKVTVTVDYSDWGKPVTVDAPAPDEVGRVFPR